jgi:hypothetical protein
MIKKYNQYINESFNGFKTIGEYIESISKDNDYALNIISQYTKDIDPTVRLANAINLLPKSTQELIVKLITDEKNGEEPKEADVIAYTSANLNESVETLAGKKILQCFLKVITALGQKEISYNSEKTPKDFIFYLETDLQKVENVKSVMSRYQFFDQKINSVEYTFTFCNLYYGIKTDGNFEYGIRTEDQFIIIGKFMISSSILKYFLNLTSPSSKGLKKQIATLDLNQILLLGKIKQGMDSFNPGTFEKKLKPSIIDNVISFGYFNQSIDINEIENIKSNLKSFLIPFKWSDKLQVNVTVSGNHLFLNIKVK